MIKKYKLKLDSFEMNLIIRALNEFRNQMIREGNISIDCINEILLKVIETYEK